MLEIAEALLQSKLILSVTFLFGIYLYLKFVIFNYWKKHCIPHENSTIPMGSILPVILGKKAIGEMIQESYKRFKSNPFHGVYMFHKPHLVINDPNLIRLIIIKDFAHFHDRGLYFNNDVDPLSGHLFFMPGEEWRFLRSKLTPTFTSGKIKKMFPLIEKVAYDLIKALGDSIEKSGNVLDVKDILGRYTTDVISSIAFGIECHSLSNPQAEFRNYGIKSIQTNPLSVALSFFFPKVLDILRIPLNSKEVTKFFNKVFMDVIFYRRTNHVIRNDFLNLLMQLMGHEKVEDHDRMETKDHNKIGHSTDDISMSEACAQAFVFFVAGFETSSSTSTFCLYELAFNLEIQDKIRKEIKDTLGDRINDVTYEDVHAMPYLDKVISETLRKYPIVPILNRVCIKDYEIPNSNYCIPKGMNIIIPVLGLHKDSEIYPDPEKFKPDRFNADEVAKRHAFTYLPFGEGPRICIGKRFGLLQVKIALIKILSKYRITVSEKTEIQLKLSLNTVLLSPENETLLRFESI